MLVESSHVPSLTTSLLRQLAHHQTSVSARILDGFRTLFLCSAQRLFFPAESLQACERFPNVSKVDTIAVCERERVAHVCCAALAQCMPMHAHCDVVSMRVLFLKKKENRSARFAKAATSSYLVDVSLKCLLRVVSSLRGTAFVQYYQ